MSNAIPTQPDLTAAIDSDRRKFKLLFRLTFAFFLLYALLGRLMPASWRPATSRHGAKESLIEEARRVANTVLPFVFVQ